MTKVWFSDVAHFPSFSTLGNWAAAPGTSRHDMALSIRPMQWANLPELHQTAALDDSDLDCLEEIRGVLSRHEKLARFAVHLREREAMAALALEFTILTAARSGEVLGARWPEIDLAANVWTIPPARTKAGREHRAPLSSRALAILEKLAAARAGEFVFFGQQPDRPLSPASLQMVLRLMKVEGATVHGFRSSFRDWAGNETHFPRELAEAALAHVIGDRSEQAYRRGDALEKRRVLMEAWAGYCEPKDTSNVVRLAV
jgi:integrase